MNSLYLLAASASADAFNYYDSWTGDCVQGEIQLSPIVFPDSSGGADSKTLELIFNKTDEFVSEQTLSEDSDANKSLDVAVTNKTDATSVIKVVFESIEYTFESMRSQWGVPEHSFTASIVAFGSFQATFTAPDVNDKNKTKTLIMEIAVNFDDAGSVDSFPACTADAASSGGPAAFNPLTLVEGKSARHYVGSVTTPECASPVDWIVIGEAISVKDTGLVLADSCNAFADLFQRCADPTTDNCKDQIPGNYRSPVDKLDATTVSTISQITRSDPTTPAPVSASSSLVMLPGMIFALGSMMLF